VSSKLRELSEGQGDLTAKIVNESGKEMVGAQAADVSESSASIEEMSSSISNIAKATEGKLRIANELQDLAKVGEREMSETIGVIQKATESTNAIMEMLQVINGIAEIGSSLKKVNAISAVTKEDVEAISGVVSGINASFDLVAKSSETNARNLADLDELIRKFKTE
jgi:methyl-accepting chemotaxis protein